MSALQKVREKFGNLQAGTDKADKSPFVSSVGSSPKESEKFGPLPPELSRRIRAMAARWQYAPEELAEALNCAAADPAAWLGACELDEELHRHRRPNRWRDIDAAFWPEEQ